MVRNLERRLKLILNHAIIAIFYLQAGGGGGGGGVQYFNHLGEKFGYFGAID